MQHRSQQDLKNVGRLRRNVEHRWAYFSWCVFSQMSTKQLSIISIHTFNFTYYFYARVPALFQSLWPNGSWNQWALKVLIPRLSQQRQRLNAIIARLTWLGSWMQHTKRTLILSICPPASTHQHLKCYPHPCYFCKLNFHVHKKRSPATTCKSSHMFLLPQSQPQSTLEPVDTRRICPICHCSVPVESWYGATALAKSPVLPMA